MAAELEPALRVAEAVEVRGLVIGVATTGGGWTRWSGRRSCWPDARPAGDRPLAGRHPTNRLVAAADRLRWAARRAGDAPRRHRPAARRRDRRGERVREPHRARGVSEPRRRRRDRDVRAVPPARWGCSPPPACWAGRAGWRCTCSPTASCSSSPRSSWSSVTAGTRLRCTSPTATRSCGRTARSSTRCRARGPHPSDLRRGAAHPPGHDRGGAVGRAGPAAAQRLLTAPDPRFEEKHVPPPHGPRTGDRRPDAPEDLRLRGAASGRPDWAPSLRQSSPEPERHWGSPAPGPEAACTTEPIQLTATRPRPPWCVTECGAVRGQLSRSRSWSGMSLPPARPAAG